MSWAYDAEKNEYVRSHGDGKQHIDNNTDKPITAKNVVVAFMEESTADDGYEHGSHLLYDTLAGGDAVFFKNGEAIKANWKKNKHTDQIRFYDESGDEIEFVRGKIWISGLPEGNTVDY